MKSEDEIKLIKLKCFTKRSQSRHKKIEKNIMSCLVGLCADRQKPIPTDNLMHEISTNCARKSLHKLTKNSECIISSDEFVIRWIKQKTTNEFRHRISSRLHILVVFHVGQCSRQSDQVQARVSFYRPLMRSWELSSSKAISSMQRIDLLIIDLGRTCGGGAGNESVKETSLLRYY